MEECEKKGLTTVALNNRATIKSQEAQKYRKHHQQKKDTIVGSRR